MTASIVAQRAGPRCKPAGCTLKLLVDSGLIREVIVHPGSVFYDPNTSEHYHLYDVATGRLTDVDAADVRIQGLAKLAPGAVIEGVDMIVRVRRR